MIKPKHSIKFGGTKLLALIIVVLSIVLTILLSSFLFLIPGGINIVNMFMLFIHGLYTTAIIVTVIVYLFRPMRVERKKKYSIKNTKEAGRRKN